MEGTIGAITIFAADFQPRNYAFCSGQIIAISQNTALFSILGTTYGGNGVQTFALPDLRSRCPVSQGAGPGISPYSLGEMTGTETVTLNANNLPSHLHNGGMVVSLQVFNADGDLQVADAAYLASNPGGFTLTPGAGQTMKAPVYTGTTIGTAGSSSPISLLSPYLAINYVICMYGIFPSRN